MALPKKVLIALSSNNDQFYADGKRTGVFWSEAAHPYHVFKKAGFEVDFASENGKYYVDEHSLDVESGFISAEDLAEYKDSNSDLQKDVYKTQDASVVDADKYGIFFAAGGHATLFDFPNATKLQHIAEKIYANGGIVSAVCHGPAILENIRDLKTGEILIKGKKVTGFTDEGEELMQLNEIIKQKNLSTLESVFEKLGAIYVPPKGPWDNFNIADGRLVTGPNPQSATSTAEKVVEVFNAL